MIRVPPLSYFIRQAAGAERGAMRQDREIAGYLSLKHVYEIAKVKSADPMYDCVPLQKICKDIIQEAFYMGVKVVPKIDEEEYRKFLEERKQVVANQLKELEDKRQAKMLRTA